MKDFLKTTLAVILGSLIVGGIMTFILFGALGALVSLGKSQPVMPRTAVLRVDFANIGLTEQTQEVDIMSAVSGNDFRTLGILDAIRAINTAAADPAIKYIYLKPDMVKGEMAEIEELRSALLDFRKSGKAVISYIENPTNAGYYLATAADKVYMSPHPGALNMLNGISSQMIFLKDILDRLGVNVQLIRHGKYKSAGETFIRDQASPENLAQNQELISSIWDAWVEEIAQSRDISAKDFNEALNSLALNLPEDFLKAGLVDELLTSAELQTKLTEYYHASGSEKPAMISISDYVTLKVLPNYRAANRVAVIFADGNIIDGDDEMQIAGDRFIRLISDIREDKSIQAVVLRVNSPGGSAYAADKIREAIKLLSEEKPVIASFGGYAASGGYWISAGCDYIFTNSSTLTGSIGVFSMIPDFSRTLKNVAHVNITTVNTNDHSDIYTGLRPLNDKEIKYMQAAVENIYDEFTTIVAEGRDMEKEYVDSIAQGRVWSGKDAVRLGLADSKGSLMDAIRYAIVSSDAGKSSPDVSDWDIVSYPKPLTAIEMLTKNMNGSTKAKVFKDTPLENVETTFKSWNSSQSGQVYARLPYEIMLR